MLQLIQLGNRRSDPLLVRNAKGRNANAGTHIDIGLARRIGQHASLAGNQLHGKAAIGSRHIFFIQRDNAHFYQPFITMVPAPSSVSSSIRME